jgi:hypothetical protein
LRVAIGMVRLEKSLARGQFRQLTEDEIGGLLDPAGPDEPGSPPDADAD